MESNDFFDSRYYVNQLIETGFESEQADAVVELSRRAAEDAVSRMLATQDDFESESSELREAIAEIRAELCQAVQKLQEDLRTQALSIVGSVTALGVTLRIFS